MASKIVPADLSGKPVLQTSYVEPDDASVCFGVEEAQEDGDNGDVEAAADVEEENPSHHDNTVVAGREQKEGQDTEVDAGDLKTKDAPSRRNSIRDSLLVMQDEIGKTVEGAFSDENVDESSRNAANAKLTFPIVHNPVSFALHTASTNVQGLISALPSCFIIVLMKWVNEEVVTLGGDGFFGDMHVVRCLGCLLCVDGLVLTIRWERDFTRRMFFIKLPGQLFFMFIVSSVFHWEIGGLAIFSATLAFSWGELCGYPLEDPRPPLRKYALQSLTLGMALHGVFVILINVLVLITRLLAKSARGYITVVVTGLLFPLVIFAVRKFVTAWILNFVSAKEMAPEKRVELLGMAINNFSLNLLITPTVLLYFNSSPVNALTSALLQILTEIVGKIYMIWLVKKKLKLALSAGGDGAKMKRLVSGKKNKIKLLASKLNGGSIETMEEYKLRLREESYTLAIRWHYEIIAEKGCIVVAAVIAWLYFQEQVSCTSNELVLIGVIFFVLEIITDCIFVWVMTHKFGVPLLSAIPRQQTFTGAKFRAQLCPCFMFTAAGNCIAMSSSIKM